MFVKKKRAAIRLKFMQLLTESFKLFTHLNFLDYTKIVNIIVNTIFALHYMTLKY